MAETSFELIAGILVDQHYASGPQEMKKVVAEALSAAAAADGQADPPGDPRERLIKEVAEAIEASARGSE